MNSGEWFRLRASSLKRDSHVCGKGSRGSLMAILVTRTRARDLAEWRKPILQEHDNDV